MNKEIKNKLIGIGLALLIFGIDFLLKRLAIGVNFELIPGWIELVYSENTGVAFSLPIPMGFIIIVTIAFLGVGSHLAGRFFDWKTYWSPLIFGFLIGGSLGNLFDRALYGFVIDYISIWKWPIFNLADTTIVLGVVALFVLYDKIVISKNKK